MAERFFRQVNFSGGLSESDLIGPRGSFSNSFGIDIFSTPGVIKAAWEPQKETETDFITEFCKFAVDASTGTSFWFGSSGTIYNRTGDATPSWGTVYKGGAITGAGEFRDFIYWVNGQNVLRIPVNGNWTSGVVSWGSVNSSTYNPMVNMRSHLLIGSGTTLASVDDTGTITASGIPNLTLAAIPDNYRIVSLHKYGIDVLAGTDTTGGGATGAKLYRWDLASPTWTQDIEVPESSVNCFLTTNDNTYFQAGDRGNIYVYNGSAIAPFKKIPNLAGNEDWGTERTITYPQSSANFEGIGYFGITNNTNSAGTTTIPGLYALGRKNTSYPISLCHQFPVSLTVSKGTITNLHIGAIISGYNTITDPPEPYLVFAWQDSITKTYGVDKIFNPTIRNFQPYIDTLAVGADTPFQKTFQNYNISYRAKPASTNISLSYFKNFATTSSGTINLTDKSGYNKLVADDKIEAGAMKFRILLTSNADDTAEVNQFYTDFNEKSVL